VAVFDVAVETRGEGLALVGVASEPAAVEALSRRVALLDLGFPLEDLVVRLPDVEPERSHALVRVPVAPMLLEPRVAEPQISQAVLGSRLTVLRQYGRWYQCRSADGYLGWVHRGYLSLTDEAGARGWAMGSDAEVLFSLGAELRDEAGELLVRLPWGAHLLADGAGGARLPDGRHGVLAGEWAAAGERAARFPAEGCAVVRSALGWMGAPYLWGGITPAGVDCSGFVQVMMRLHGVDLPRDSDMQARTGELVDVGEDFEALLPGDLLFFAELGDRVTHVALSLGGPRVLHSSLGNGGVARNSLTGELEYERELRRIFVCARRVVG
jgi:cell wall-associated NlpC family hydrolase